MAPKTTYPTSTAPPSTPTFLRLSFPAPRVLLVTMCREREMNCMNTAAGAELTAVFQWLDSEPDLSVAILTGEGTRAFCSGADLKEQRESMRGGKALRFGTPGKTRERGGEEKTMGLTRRRGKKPVIAAVNGLAMGGGTEMAVNCDIVVAAESATFALPEVKRGVSPWAGALPRLIRTVGLQRASELALTGRSITAAEAHAWGLVNKVVATPADVVPEALKYAVMIAENSPDSVICTRSGLREGWETASVDEAAEITLAGPYAALLKGDNVREGLRAFSEKRKPVWVRSRL